MQIYSCLLVDDEPPARDVLKHYIENMPMLTLAGECSNAFEAISFLQNHSIEIMFLDIQMPELSGMDFLRTLTNPPKTIFTTAFEGYALESYELDAVDYLLKPVSLERFIKAINKVISKKEVQLPGLHQTIPSIPWADSFLYFRSERKMIKVVLEDILYVESLKDYVKIVTLNGPVVTKYAMSAMEAMLPEQKFMRIHRSFMVSVDKITSFSQTHIQLAVAIIPIGKLYQREVIRKLCP